MSSEALSGLSPQARIPNSRDKVFNEECIFSFDTPVRS